MKRILAVMFILLSLTLVIGASGCQQTATYQGTPSTTTPAQVNIKNFAFFPAEITISPGTIVAWTNNDAYKHTITADDNSFSLDVLASQSVTKTFDSAGTYAYHCSIHPSMKGTIVVK